MTDPNTPTINTATLRAALKLKLTETAAGAGIALRPDAVDDLVRKAAAELVLDDKGFTVRQSDGRFVPCLEWLTGAQKSSPWFFAGGSQPERPGASKTVNAGAMGKNLEGIAAGDVGVQLGQRKTGNRKVIPASEMGANLEAIAEGKVLVECRGLDD